MVLFTSLDAQLKEHYPSVVPTSCKYTTIWAEADVVHTAFVATNCVQRASLYKIEDARSAIAASRYHVLTIGVEVQTRYLVGVTGIVL